MIASVRGEVVDLGAGFAVVECAGVGHLVTATARTLATLRRGEPARLLTTLVVREDSMTLYGFADDEERRMFEVLQTVSKLGPRLALAVLEALTPAEIAAAVAAEDAKALARANGVGTRMAARMIVELGEKVAPFAAPAGEPAAGAAGPAPAAAAGGAGETVVEALLGLGFARPEAAAAAERVLAADPELDVSGALRAALAELGRN